MLGEKLWLCSNVLQSQHRFQVRHNEQKCCTELPVWVGENFTTPAFDQPTSKRITTVCTPWICNIFESPMFNLGTHKVPSWIQVNFGAINHIETPKDFIPLSTNKGEQIVLRHSGIYGDKQKREFQKLSLVKDARKLVTLCTRFFPEPIWIMS